MAFFDNLSKKASDFADAARTKTSGLSQDISKAAETTWGNSCRLAAKTWEDTSRWTAETWEQNIPSKEELSEWASGAGDYISSLAKDFDISKMWDKIKDSASKAGQELVVMTLTMYYTITESRNKNGKQ